MAIIDGDELRNRIQRWYGRKDFSSDGMLSIIETEIINSPNLWIPVTKRLPEKEGEYFVTIRYNNGDKHVAQWYWTKDDGFPPKIVAWMDLKPYEGG